MLVDVQRGGPSTGLPTKTEQSDLLLAMYGRHGESPLPIVAAQSPSHCFAAAFEAVRIALKYRTPVILLTDGYVANGSEPWKLPDVDALPDISVPFAEPSPTTTATFWPYLRDPETLARPWAIPGTPGPDAPHRRHREAGRHRQRQLRARQPRAHDPPPGRQGGAASPRDIPPSRGRRRRRAAEVLVLGWGSTWGPISEAVRRVRAGGAGSPTRSSCTSTRSPPTWATSCARYRKVLVPEMNLGQLSRLVRAEFLVDARSLTKVQGLPFSAAEIEAVLVEMIDG